MGPERTCVTCRSRRPKDDLLRIARLSAGGVVVDPAARAQGRGAYVCRDESCVAGVGRALPRVLRAPLAEDDLARLREEMERELE